MRQRLSKEAIDKIIANTIVVVISITFAIIVYRFENIFAFLQRVIGILFPFFLGLGIAVVATPILNGTESFLRPYICRKKPRKGMLRVISMLITYAVFIAVLGMFFSIVLPQLITSIGAFIQSAPSYIRSLTESVREFTEQYNITNEYLQEIFGSWESLLLRSVEYLSTQIPVLISMTSSISSGISNVVLGCILSVYMLSGKERFSALARKISMAFITEQRVDMFAMWSRKTYSIFTRYISGTLLHSLIVGMLCYFGMLIWGMPYAMLISVIVGVTNVIPIIGPLIGGVIGSLILLFINPMQAVGFAVFVLVLQQFDGNVLGPRILGNSIGISSFWVVLAIIIGGGFFGVTGMFVSIPLFALAYAIIQTYIEMRLVRRELPSATSEYLPPDPEPRAMWTRHNNPATNLVNRLREKREGRKKKDKGGGKKK